MLEDSSKLTLRRAGIKRWRPNEELYTKELGDTFPKLSGLFIFQSPQHAARGFGVCAVTHPRRATVSTTDCLQSGSSLHYIFNDEIAQHFLSELAKVITDVMSQALHRRASMDDSSRIMRAVCGIADGLK